MKILHVIGEMGYGGAELLTAEMAARFVKAGHQVDVMVIGFCEGAVIEKLAQDGVRLLRLGARQSNPLSALRVARAISSGGYDVVHGHLFPALYWLSIARVLARTDARYFYTEHSTSNRRRKHSILRGLERSMYQRYDRIVCISQDVASSLDDWLPGLSPLVIGNGIDVARFESAAPLERARLGIPDEVTVVVMVGAFRKEKNHEALVDALTLLPDGFVVAFAGDGPERAAVQRRARVAGVDGRVKFLGVVKNVEGLLKASDVFVLPSLFEGFGLSAIEACASGLPVVHSDVPGLTAVLEGVGWPFDPSNAQQLAQQILTAAAGGEAVETKRVRARALARKHGVDATVVRHASLYTGGVA